MGRPAHEARARWLAAAISMAGAAPIACADPSGAALVSLDAQTGETRWTRRIGEPRASIRGIFGDSVYLRTRNDCGEPLGQHAFGIDDGRRTDDVEYSQMEIIGGLALAWQSDDVTTLQVFDEASGDARWSRDITGSIPAGASGPIVLTLFRPVQRDSVIDAYESRDGTHLWTRTLGDSVSVYVVHGQEAASEVVVLQQVNPGALFAVDARSGAERWRFDDRTMRGSARMDGQHIVYRGEGSHSDTYLQVVDADTGTPVWRRDYANVDFERIHPGIAVAGGRVFGHVSSWEDKLELFAFEIATGDVAWKSDGPLQTAGVAADADRVYVTDVHEEIIALDAATGQLLWQTHLPHAIVDLDSELHLFASAVLMIGHGVLDSDDCH